MKRLFAVVLSGIAALGVAVAAAPAAQAAEGQVIVFSTELQPLDVYRDPTGCHKLPLEAHIIANMTDQDIVTYADPLCLTPGLRIKPSHGSHVALSTGSFSADG